MAEITSIEFSNQKPDTEDELETIKIVLIGNPEVGKTALLSLFSHQEVVSHYVPSTARDLGEVYLKVKDTQNEHLLAIKLFDFPGTKEFRDEMIRFGGQSNVFFIMVDLTKPFEGNPLNVLEEIKKFGHPVYVVGTKADLVSDRVCSADDGKDFVDVNGFEGYEELSAVDLNSIHSFFERFLHSYYPRILPILLRNLEEKERKRRKKGEEKVERIGGSESSCFPSSNPTN